MSDLARKPEARFSSVATHVLRPSFVYISVEVWSCIPPALCQGDSGEEMGGA